MLKAPDSPLHSLRLADLVRRFRAQEMSLVAALADLQAECDVIATELAHVRLALHGAKEELAASQDGQLGRASIPA